MVVDAINTAQSLSGLAMSPPFRHTYRMTETDSRRMIRASFVEEALDGLRRRGLPVAPVLAGAGLDWQPGSAVSVDWYGRLWLAVATAMEDEFLGLGGRPMRPGAFTLMGHATLGAATLEQALRRALRFLDVVLDDPRGRLVVENGLAQVVLQDRGAPRSAFAYRTYWIILHGLMCWLVRRRLPLVLVDFRGTEPEGVADYRLFFGAPVRFGCGDSRLAFDARHLALPVNRSERALKQFLRAAPANILVRYRYDGGPAAALRRMLRADPPPLWPSFEQAAARLRIPPSSLRRRLLRDGLGWSVICDEIRRELALAALQADARSVAEIASDLGYAEPSAFHRAFRKWTGQTPGAFRRAAR